MTGPVTLTPLHGIPEVREGDDLVELLDRALAANGIALEDGDILVVSSKIASKALGLFADDADKDRVVAAESEAVVAERRIPDGVTRVTRVVRAKAGPVMAAAGVDGSNTGARGGWLLLPRDPDAICREIHGGLVARHGVRLGVLLSDTAGRAWRLGQVDLALGAHGVRVLEDLRGTHDADGRLLEVTARAVADEIASAADLVKGKAQAVPAALVRGLSELVVDERTPSGARGLVRTGSGDWFGHGRVEAVRAALGIAPGSALSEEVGIPSAGPEGRLDRVSRAVSVALAGVDGATADIGPESVTIDAETPYDLGVLAARLRAALWCEWLAASSDPPPPGALTLTMEITEPDPT